MGTMVGFVMPFSWLPLQHGLENTALSLVESGGSLPCPLDLYLTFIKPRPGAGVNAQNEVSSADL